ncbi:MAG: hypothetical protein CMQ07_08985 [Gammaproteobacteria bacterium]|nr:hypothetical protein [Gammaproteobacteria bacterium]
MQSGYGSKAIKFFRRRAMSWPHSTKDPETVSRATSKQLWAIIGRVEHKKYGVRLNNFWGWIRLSNLDLSIDRNSNSMMFAMVWDRHGHF